MKFDRKKVTAAANDLLKEIDNIDIIQSVLNEKVKDRNILASLNFGHVSFEIWKKKDGEFDVVKSSYPKEKHDFRKVMSKKQLKEDFLIDILNNTIKAFNVEENERKQILAKLNENK